MIPRILTLVLLFFSRLCFAQFTEHYTVDTLTEPGQPSKSIFYQNHVYVLGISTDNEGPEFIVRKLDTLGKVVWSNVLLTPRLGFPPTYQCFHLSTLDDQYLLVGISDYSSLAYTMLKIDLKTGAIISKNLDTNGGYTYTELSFASKDTAVFIVEAYYDLILATFDKLSGKTVQTYKLGGRDQNPFAIVGDKRGNVYYSKGDTIFKINYQNPGSKLWTLPFPALDKITISKLYLDPDDGTLYAFGQAKYNNTIPIVVKIDPQAGKIIWSTKIEDLGDFIFSAMDVSPISLYISWNDRFAGGAYYTPTSKIDKQTGAIIWSKSHRFDPSLPISQRTTVITAGSDGIYLLGHDWGIMKLDTLSGAKIYSFQVNIYESIYDLQGYSPGRNIFETPTRLISIGQKPYRSISSKEVFLTLDKTTGKIITEKDYGGLKQYDAQTIQMLATPQGQFIAIQQIGAMGKVVLFDADNTPVWEYFLPQERKLIYAKILNDSLLAVLSGGFNLDLFNFVKKKFLKNFPISNTDYSTFFLAKPSIVFHPPNMIFVAIHRNASEPQTAMYRIDLPENFNSLNEHTLFIRNSVSLPSDKFSVNNVLVPLNKDTIIFINGYSIEKRSIPSSDIRDDYKAIPTGFVQKVHLDHYQHNFLLALGYDRSEQVMLTKINRADFTKVWTTSLPVYGQISKWIPSEVSNMVYIIVNQTNRRLHLLKYNTENQTVIWQKTLFETPTESVHFTDICLNQNDQSLLIAGYTESTPQNKKAIFINIGFDGTIQSNLLAEGDFPGNNQGLCVLHLEPANKSYFGGSINKSPQKASSAFIYSFSADQLNNSIKGLIFWDKNSDGKQSKDEPGVALGDVFLGFSTRVYHNAEGQFKTLVPSGQFTLRYRVPEHWILTSGEFSYPIDASNIQNLKDTFRFGIIPIQIVNKIDVSATGQQLVCNEEAPLYVIVKNKGTSIQNVKLRLDFEGTPILQNMLPDSIRQRAMYWTFDSLSPGATRWIKLDFLIPGVGQIGDSLVYKSTAFYQQAPNIVDSTIYRYHDILLCSYDPNDKLVRPEGLQKNKLTLFNQYLNYTIRFQNTGNFPARHITIIDTIDRDLDFATFEFLNASHPITEVTGKGNVAKFVFKNINLPDSTNNEPESHGFVSFRIKDRSGLAEKTTIENTAYIYFDQNPAIVTNTTQNIMVSKFEDISTSSQDKFFPPNFKLYPNPAQDYFILDASMDNFSNIKWKMINTLGKTCLEGNTQSFPQHISTHNLPNGMYYLIIEGRKIMKVVVTH